MKTLNSVLSKTDWSEDEDGRDGRSSSGWIDLAVLAGFACWVSLGNLCSQTSSN